jgi:CBS domain-containing protein
MTQLIADLMEREVVTVNMDESVDFVLALFSRRRLNWAPVLDAQGQLVGVISAWDLLPFRSDLHDPSRLKAWQLCTYRPITVPVDTPAVEVARLMAARQVHHVVVTDRAGIAGVVSSLDFVRAFADTREA